MKKEELFILTPGDDTDGRNEKTMTMIIGEKTVKPITSPCDSISGF
jgi:hypothetical protein